MTYMEFAGWTVTVTHKPIRKMYLRVHGATGAVSVSAPVALADRDIRQFIENHRDWIDQRRAQAEAERFRIPGFTDGAALTVLGQHWTIRVQSGASRRSAVSGNATVTFHIKTDDGPDQVQRLADRWIDGQILQAVELLIGRYAEMMGVTPGALAVRSMRSRWGSCNVRTGRICVNRALAWADPLLLEYIVVHELAHLIEPGHSARFYAVVDRHFPLRKRCEQDLRRLSRTLV